VPTNVTKYLEKDFSVPIVRLNIYPTITTRHDMPIHHVLMLYAY